MAAHHQAFQRSPAAIARIDQVSEPVDRGEVIRYLGYPTGARPSPAVAAALDEWIARASRSAAPRAVYRTLRVVQLEPRRVKLAAEEGDVEFRGAIGEFLGEVEHVAAFIATAGEGVERLASELMEQGETLAAAIVSAVGAERAEAAEAAVIDELRTAWADRGVALTLPYSPGYCGMALGAQRTLFSLFTDAAGVSLTSDCLMRPLKSVSGLIGLGPAERVLAAGSPCQRCELYTCAMRR